MKKSIEILFEDENYVVVNKPGGLLSIPDRFDTTIPNVLQELRKQYNQILTVHRIDRYTSGALCFAKNELSHRHLSMQFENHTVEKTYLALVHGRTPEQGEINYRIFEDPRKPGRMDCSPTFGKPALTRFKTITSFDSDFSWVEVYPETGRTHQIRVHMLAIGHPLAVDELYGNPDGLFLSAIKRKYKQGKFTDEEKPLIDRLTLHASKIIFKNVHDEKLITVEAPLPKDLSAVLKQLSKW